MAKEKIEKAEANGEETVTVKLPLIRGEDDIVFVRVNQRTFWIKRGVEVEVPSCVAEVLEHSEDAIAERIAYENAHSKG